MGRSFGNIVILQTRFCLKICECTQLRTVCCTSPLRMLLLMVITYQWALHCKVILSVRLGNYLPPNCYTTNCYVLRFFSNFRKNNTKNCPTIPPESGGIVGQSGVLIVKLHYLLRLIVTKNIFSFTYIYYSQSGILPRTKYFQAKSFFTGREVCNGRTRMSVFCGIT